MRSLSISGYLNSKKVVDYYEDFYNIEIIN
jgi:hypothetical protein